MKVIAVSQRVQFLDELNEVRDVLDHRLTSFLFAAGFVPVAIPNNFCEVLPYGAINYQALNLWLDTLKPSAFVLSGGNDIGECRARDLTEGHLLDYASENFLPVLGICRGMQMMAFWAGADLRLVKGHIGVRHQIMGEIFGEVNSYHSFSIDCCPKGFEVLAKSQDQEIEAIRHLSLPWEGWMWHPERENFFLGTDLQRIRCLFGE